MFRTVQMCACIFLLLASAPQAYPQNVPAAGAASGGSNAAGDDTTAGFQKSFLNSLAYGPKEFPHVWNPYRQQPMPHPVLVNSPRLHSLIHDGKLELSLADALALTLENNLDIVVQRYVIPFAQTDILRTKSGQAARGFTGALYPERAELRRDRRGRDQRGRHRRHRQRRRHHRRRRRGLVGAAGAFDPSVSFSHQLRPRDQPAEFAGGLRHSHHHQLRAIASSASYAQLFTTGTSYSVSLSTLRQITTQKNTLYNPDVTSRLSIGFNQPLLAGFGRMANERFMTVARNNREHRATKFSGSR